MYCYVSLPPIVLHMETFNINGPQKKFLSMPVLVALFVVLFIVVLVMFAVSNNKSEQKEVYTQEKTVVYKTDANALDGNKLPEGFPSSIPVEISTIQEGIKTEFPEREMTQYSVTYLSAKTMQQIRETYIAYISKEGYTLQSGQSLDSTNQLYAKKDNDDLSVVFEQNAAGTKVMLGYLDRK